MIEARAIRKSYDAEPVLDGASLEVRPGECVVLAGANGSGKTTLLHVMVGLRRADAGEVLWKDRALTGAGRGTWRKAREDWAFLPQRLSLPPDAPIERLLDFHARLRGTGTEAAKAWLERVGLGDASTRRVDELSGGMRQRLGIALSLFFDPQLIVMDEPASSLDPDWRVALIEWIGEQTERGTAVLLTSQLSFPWGPDARYLRCVDGRAVPDTAGAEAKN